MTLQEAVHQGYAWCADEINHLRKRVAELGCEWGFAQARFDSCLAQYNIVEARAKQAEAEAKALQKALENASAALMTNPIAQPEIDWLRHAHKMAFGIICAALAQTSPSAKLPATTEFEMRQLRDQLAIARKALEELNDFGSTVWNKARVALQQVAKEPPP
jgi:hypothetical protein